MFECTIELLSTFTGDDGEPLYLTVARFSSDPGFLEEEEVFINYPAWGTDDLPKDYELKAKVIGRRKEVYHANPRLIRQNGEAAKTGLFRLRVFVEAEDRDTVLELREAIDRNTQTG